MLKQLVYRYIFILPIICGLFIQTLKILFYSLANKRVTIEKFFQADGIPNLHSAAFSSMATGIGIKHGHSSLIFSLISVYSIIIIHDTIRVKSEKVKQLDVLTDIISNIKTLSKDLENVTLKVLQFRAFDVISGACLGILLAFLIM